MKVELSSFSPSDDLYMLDFYLREKYSTFYKEYDWNLLSVDGEKRKAHIDQYDLNSIFFNALVDTYPVGFLRATDTKFGLPHSCLFKNFRKVIHQNKVASLNALCVNKSYRGKFYFVDNTRTKLGTAMLSYCIQYLRNEGYDLIVTSTSKGLTEKIFRPLGFVELETGINYQYSPELVTNLAFLLNKNININ